MTTVEGIGNAKDRLHAVQQRMANSHGSQCGFCTPGIVMSMYTLLRNNPLPSMEEIETYFQVLTLLHGVFSIYMNLCKLSVVMRIFKILKFDNKIN